MIRQSKRQYLRAIGALGLGVLAPAGVLGTAARSPTNASAGDAVRQQTGPQSGDRLDYERDAADDIDFDWGDVTFETRGNVADLDDAGFSLESKPLQAFELDVDLGVVRIDLDISVGSGFDFEIDANGVSVSAEADASGRLELSQPAAGVELLEEGNGEFELRAGDATVEFSVDARKLEITGPLALEISGDGEGTVSFEYDDGVHVLDLERSGLERVLDLEYAGPEVTLEWTEADREFDARKA